MLELKKSFIPKLYYQFTVSYSYNLVNAGVTNKSRLPAGKF